VGWSADGDAMGWTAPGGLGRRDGGRRGMMAGDELSWRRQSKQISERRACVLERNPSIMGGELRVNLATKGKELLIQVLIFLVMCLLIFINGGPN